MREEIIITPLPERREGGRLGENGSPDAVKEQVWGQTGLEGKQAVVKALEVLGTVFQH